MRARTSAPRGAVPVLAVLAACSVLASPDHAASQAPDQAAEVVVGKVRFEPIGADGVPMIAEGVGPYKGAIEAVPSGGGLMVVNDLALEDYVKGIVEVPSEWPAEAQRAQAIAARTYALYRKKASYDTDWRAAGADLCATDACQVYWGVRGEQRSGGESWIAAVDSTAGQVLLFEGEPIRATYAASNGGSTVDGGAPYLQAMDDPDDARSNLSRWQYTLPLGALAPVLGVEPPDVLTSVTRQDETVVFTVNTPAQAAAEPAAPAPGQPPAPTTTEAPGPPPRELSMPVSEFGPRAQTMLSTPEGLPLPLPSFRFDLRTEGGTVVVDGRGWGHSVGMSQYGALGKAERGLDAAEILAEYYGGITPTRLDPADLTPTIRVAVTPAQGALTITAPTFVRVLDGQGAVIAPVALGAWRATPSSGGVRVTPPEDQQGPLVVDTVAVEPAAPAVGATAMVRFRVSSPAMVSVRATPPGAPAQQTAPQIANAGNVTVAIPPGSADGSYDLVVVADGGRGRVASVPLRFVVGKPRSAAVAPAARPPTVRPPEDEHVGAALVALAVAFIVVDVLLAISARRRRRAVLAANLPASRASGP